jgi:hypothetical protein
VPRGITVFAGGKTSADATSFALSAEAGHPQYSIGETEYLTKHASSRSYRVTITIHDDDTWSYHETTILQMDEFAEPLEHTDHNTVHRVG